MGAFFTKLCAFFTTLTLIAAYLCGTAQVSVTDGYEYLGADKLVLTGALKAGQGICTDGEFYYTSGSVSALGLSSLAKWDKNMKCLKTRNAAIPKEFSKTCGSDHIGGIDCADGILYASLEGKPYDHNFILLYDCDTLTYTGRYYEISHESMTDGIPWCAVDGENGYLYTSRYGGAEKILRYRLSDMSLDGEIVLSETVDRIQGGDVYEGTLYLSCDAAHSVEEPVYSVDLSTGEVTLLMMRTQENYDNEAEDLCVFPMSDGSLFHVLDYDKLLGINVRHYK